MIIEDKTDGDLHHSDDNDTSNLSDDIESGVSERYSNNTHPDEMPHSVASRMWHLIMICTVYQCILTRECFCFSLFTETKDDDQMLDDEIDGDLHHSDDEDISNSSEDQDSDYSEKFHRNCGKRKQIPRNNQTRRERSSDRKVKNDIDLMDELDMMEGEQNIENKKNASRNVGQRKPAFQSPEPYRNNATKKGKEVPSDTKSGKKKVAFQCQEPYRNNVTKKGNEIGSDGDGVKRRVAFQSPELFDVTRKGKVIPSESKTGKGPAKKGSSDKVDDGGEGFFRIDQTLAGSFSDVGDVFGE